MQLRAACCRARWTGVDRAGEPALRPGHGPSPPRSRAVLTLIDASGFIFRAYHAIPPLDDEQGRARPTPCWASPGWCSRRSGSSKPTHVALAFDKESRTGARRSTPTTRPTARGRRRIWSASSR